MRRPKTRDELEIARRKEIVEKHQISYRGRKMQEIISSDGWIKYVQPHIKAEEERLIKESRFDPLRGDAPSVERLAFLNSFNSGAIFMLNALQETMYHWMNEGLEAEGRLKEIKKKMETPNENKLI